MRWCLTAVSCAALAGLGLAGGCVFPTSSKDEATLRPTTVETAVTNQTTVTVRVSLHAGERVRLRGAPITPIKDGKAVEIIPGSTDAITLPRPRSWGFGTSSEDLVYWMRCEVITPTWGEDRVRWFEMLGPPASKVTLSASAGAKGSDLKATGSAVPVEEIDPSLHPFRDRNNAFRTAEAAGKSAP